MHIRFTDIKKDRSDIRKIKQLYKSAFPPAERAPFHILLRGAKKKNVDFLSCMNGDEWVGMFYVVNHLDMSYVFYFAVAEEKRRKGFGTAILKAALEKYGGRRLFLAIEEVGEQYGNFAERAGRLRFYENAGFVRTGQKVQEADVIYDLMSNNAIVSNDEYRELLKTFLGFRMLFVTMRIF